MSPVLLLFILMQPVAQSSMERMEASNERKEMKAFDAYADSLYEPKKMGDAFKYPKHIKTDKHKLTLKNVDNLAKM